MSLFERAKTIKHPYKSFVSFRSTVLSQTSTVCFLLPDMYIRFFSFFTGAPRLTSPLILSDTVFVELLTDVVNVEDLWHILIWNVCMHDEVVDGTALNSKWISVPLNGFFDSGDSARLLFDFAGDRSQCQLLGFLQNGTGS